ncbi:MAG: ABC transporter ATP-binding protein, partial [Anaerolineae bacterium]|nr:ABC transporter ATP-binding protein [Anaerolineae bacterium]
GMQQRVGIARALAVDPEILFFDEPFSALDPLIRREMQDELLKLQKMMQKTIIFITHDFLEAVKLGDDIAIMKDGEIVQVGTPDQVILNPANDYVREFTKDVPRSRVLSARAIMQPCEVVCSENESPERVQVRLQNQPSRVAFINAENGRFLGIVSRDQIDRAVPTVTETVRPLVNDSQPTVSPHTFLSDLLSIVAATDLPVPVVDSSRHLLGSVDRAAVIMALGGAVEN